MSTSNSSANGMKITVRGFLRNPYDIGCPPLLLFPLDLFLPGYTHA